MNKESIKVIHEQKIRSTMSNYNEKAVKNESENSKSTEIALYKNWALFCFPPTTEIFLKN